MAIIRINKTKDYVVMSKEHFKEKEMSLKAKGLLSEMLALPDNWEYSIAGLVAINKENETSIKNTLEELKQFGYLKITKLLPNQTKTGRIEYIYDIFEKKQEGKKQEVENLGVEFLGVENQGQYNNNILNNKELNNKNIIKEKEIKRKVFEKPTIEKIQEYCSERDNGINANAFYDFYESKDWYVGKNKMKDWKACIRTWEQRSNKKERQIPKWFNQEVKQEIASNDEQHEMEELLKEWK